MSCSRSFEKQVLRRGPRRILPRKAHPAQLQSTAELIARTFGKTDSQCLRAGVHAMGANVIGSWYRMAYPGMDTPGLARTAMRQKSPKTKSPRENSNPVLAREREVAKTEAINALLTRPIAVLPAKIGDPIRPFALGLWDEIRPLLKPEFSVTALRKAMATYVHSRSYQRAVARPGSVRHDINGTPVGPVSDADRLDAHQQYEGFKARDGSRNPKSAPPLPSTASKSDVIRAGLLKRKDTPR